jgi:putative phosphoesterase
MPRARLLIGILSDTHGLMRPQALEALRGSRLILHAGDIGSPEVIAALEEIAPVKAVRGNNDDEPWARRIPESSVIDLKPGKILLLHSRGDLDFDPAAKGIRAVVSGHSHQPGIEERDGVLYVNPGSAGPRRFSLPISVAKLQIDGKRWEASLITLNLPRTGKRD